MQSVSLNVSQLFFTPDVGTWISRLHVELCQNDNSVSVLLTTKVFTVHCIGSVIIEINRLISVPASNNHNP